MNRFRSIYKRLGVWFAPPWYPLIFSVYPVLALLAVNVGQVKPDAGFRPVLISLAIAGLLFGLLFLFLRNVYRAAFLSTLWMALFFSYGHVYISLLEKFPDINLDWWLLASWLVLAAFFSWWGTRPRLLFVDSARTLNVIALGLVIVSLVQINSGSEKRGARALGAQNAPVQELTRPENPPDIYYFILDSYTRDDLLKRAYSYDNSGFLQALRERGFYVADCSQSNYSRTELSLASSLNMSYLQGLDDKFVPESIGRLRLWDALKHSAVRYNLEQLGYQTVSYANGYPWSELEDADVFLTPPPLASGMTEFETLFIETTLMRQAQELGWVDVDQIVGQNFRDRHMLVFDTLGDVARMKGPQFVHVHLLLPHPPFVFGPNGEYTNPADFWNEKKVYNRVNYQRGYTNQLTFLNRKLLETIDVILANSETPPVIILQGDHGPWIQPNPQHFFILNAYYLPGHQDELYPTISPVNSFRLVFNDYFGAKYDMLADISYYSPVPKLYEFTEVPYPCQ